MKNENSTLSLPFDIQCDETIFLEYCARTQIEIVVPDSYLLDAASWDQLPEVICIQRLINLSRRVEKVEVCWGEGIAQEAFRSPNLFPLLSVLLCIDGATHRTNNSSTPPAILSARKRIYAYQFSADLFSDVQILLCADNRGQGRPASLYSPATGEIVSRDAFESLIDLLLSSHKGYGIANSKAIFFIKAIGTIVAELFENTDVHGRLELDGRPIRKNGLRGVIFRRVKILRSGEWRRFSATEELQVNKSVREDSKEIDALEISIFDAGVGYYSGYTKKEFDSPLSIDEEWGVVHQCLQRHYSSQLEDTRPSHRAMGLYEVLRALHSVHGRLEVRSGRVFGFRTFVHGDLKFQLEPPDSADRPNMPKPFLLDSARQFVRKPTAHEYLVGSSVRVLIPL